MTWTTPKTWADGDYPGGTTLNTHLRDQLLALYSPPMVETFRTTTLAVGSGTTQLVTFDDERFDTDWGGAAGTFHSLVSNTSRVVFPYDGLYEVVAFWQWASAPGAGNMSINLRLNAAGSSSGGTSARLILGGADRTGCYSLRTAFTAGQYLEMFASQTSGASINLSLGASVTGMYVRFLAG